jgi:rare lipoprotein A (peptidoglycan hydrolase)
MIARATLVLMLACPAAGAFGIPHPAAAETPSIPLKRERPTHATGSRRHRLLHQAAAYRLGRRELATASVSYDDRLAYDTPRGADGRPLASASAERIPLVYSASARPFQVGLASWYGGARWEGHGTSSGGRYHESDLTAAHATLPFGTQVRVRLVDSDRSVVVTITDRPGTRRRIIDLSRGAAAALGILSRGVAQVSLEPL